MRSSVIVALLLPILFTACRKAEHLSQTGSETTQLALPVCNPGEFVCGDFAEDFKNVPGLENVIQALPGDNLTNAPSDSEVTVFYRQPIETSNEQLENALVVYNEAGKEIAGTLTIDSSRTFLRFCATEAFTPGDYTATYQPVTLQGGEQVKAFSINFHVEDDAEDELPPCTFITEPSEDTVLSSR